MLLHVVKILTEFWLILHVYGALRTAKPALLRASWTWLNCDPFHGSAVAHMSSEREQSEQIRA